MTYFACRYNFSLVSFSELYEIYSPVRNMSEAEKKELYDILDTNSLIRYRAKIVLFAGEGYTSGYIDSMIMVSMVFLQRDRLFRNGKDKR